MWVRLMFSKQDWILENRGRLKLEPSGRRFSGLNCPYSKNICSLEDCMFYDQNNKTCSMLISKINKNRNLTIDFVDEMEKVIQNRKK